MSTDKRNGAVVGGWCCLILALLIGVWSSLLFVFYVPLCIAAFVLAIVSMAQRQVTHGVFMLLLSVTLPLGIMFYGFTTGWQTLNTQVNHQHSSPPLVSSSSAASPAPAATLAMAPLPPPIWDYSSDTDSISGRPIKYATLQSTSTLNFGFPYGGDQHAQLFIGTYPRLGHQVRVSVERGQIICRRFDDCAVEVRFDQAPPIRMSAAKPDDGDTTSLFILPARTFVRRLEKAKQVHVEVTFYQQGTQVLEFHSEAFSPKDVGF